MDPIATGVIVGYLVIVTVVGSLLAFRSRSSSDWAVAGGGMGVIMIAMGVAGTRIGGAGTYGVAGNVITTGMWNLWYGVSTLLALAIVGLFFAIPYRRLKLHTVGEIFYMRFGTSRCQRLTSLCVQTEYLIVNIIEPFVIAKILQGVTGLPFVYGVYVGALVIVVYTTMGGLWGSSAANMIHCTVILLGLFAVGWGGLSHLGGWSEIVDRISVTVSERGQDVASWWSFSGQGWDAIVAMIFSAVIHTPAASVYVNFSSAAKSERVLVPAFLLGGLIGAVMPLLAGWVGAEALAAYGSEATTAGYTTIARLATDVSPWIGGFALAAILAAVISSGGPILLSSATMFVNDWLPFSRDLNMHSKLRLYRITSVLYGFFAATLAIVVEVREVSILDLLLVGFAMVVPPAIAVGFLIYWKRTTEKAAFWGMLIGYGAGMIWYGLIYWASAIELTAPESASGLWHWIWYCFARDGGIDPSYVTTFVPLIAIPLFTLLTPEDADGKTEFYAKIAGAETADTNVA